MSFKESAEGNYHLSESEANLDTPEAVNEKLKALQEQLGVLKGELLEMEDKRKGMMDGKRKTVKLDEEMAVKNAKIYYVGEEISVLEAQLEKGPEEGQ